MSDKVDEEKMKMCYIDHTSNTVDGMKGMLKRTDVRGFTLEECMKVIRGLHE